LILAAVPTSPIQAINERVMPFPPERVWSVLADAGNYPNWYPPTVTVRVLATTQTLAGTKFEVRPRGGRAFRCEVKDVDKPHRIQMRYPGDLILGTGEWRLESLGSGSTRVTYTIDVVANGWVAAILGRVLPFAKLHSRAMQDLLAALEHEVARRTEAPVH
jgi:uncharacterized protein YndB with AHSA1/START domain